MGNSVPSLDAAYGTCARIVRRHGENFPVASRLLPARLRPHLAAIYAFARTADDFADEGDLAPAERLRLIDEWQARLSRCVKEEPPAATPGWRPNAPEGARVRAADIVGTAARSAPKGSVGPTDAEVASIFLALGHTIRTRRLPVALFEDLLSAFRQDVTVRRYETWNDLIDYCRRSANPVGRLVLRVAGHTDPALDEAADALCTALQLTNCWQDLGRDWARGRLYVPAADRRAFQADEADLDRGVISSPWRAVMAEMAARTRAFFSRGRAVSDGVRGRLRLEARLTWLGGVTILDRLERRGFDVFRRRPTLGPRDVPRLIWRAVVAWPPRLGTFR